MPEVVEQFPSPDLAASILAPEPSEDPTSILETDEERAVAVRILPLLAEKANKLAEANKTKQLEAEIDRLRVANEAMIKAKIDELTAANKPLEFGEVQKLISQEYLDIPIKVREGRTKREREFTLCELSQAVEQKFLQKITKSIVPHLKELQTLDWSQGSMAEKITMLVEALPGTLDLLAELAALALDPYGEEKVDAQWVAANMSSKRIMDVVEGQIAVSRFRDFFSAVYRLFPGQRLV